MINVRVQPRAKSDGFAGVAGDRLKIHINAPPVAGKANTQLIRYLARLFKVPKSRVEIINGQTSGYKRIRIAAPKQLPEMISSHKNKLTN